MTVEERALLREAANAGLLDEAFWRAESISLLDDLDASEAQAEARVKELEGVIADLRTRLETAVADEREACAMIVDHWRGCDAIAAAIRARASEAVSASRAGTVPND